MQVLEITGLISAGVGFYIALIFLSFYFVDRIIRGEFTPTFLLIFIFLFGASIGVLGQNMVYFTTHGPPMVARFWEQIQHLGLFIIFPVWIHFIFRYVLERKASAYIISIYFISLFCIITSFTTDWLFISNVHRFKDIVSFTFGPLYSPLLIFLFVNILSVFALMVINLVRSYGKDRRFKFVFVISSGLTIITGLKDLLETWVETPLPQLFSYGILLAAVTYLFAILFRLRDVYRDYLQKRDMEREFRFAQDTQNFFIASHIEMDAPAFEAAGMNKPGRYLGGDIYHLACMPDGRYLLLIGDISGKGLASSLYMHFLLSFFVALDGISDGPHLEQIIGKANRLLYQRSKSGMYATLFSAVWDPSNRVLTYINAGHIFPRLYRADKKLFLNSPGMPLGIEPEAVFKCTELKIRAGDFLMLSTDGFFENLGLDEDNQEIDRFITSHMSLPCRQSILELMQLTPKGRKIQEFEDDMTCMLIRFKDA
jgi:hypothetical protein